MDQILSPAYLNAAYLQVRPNGGAGEADKMRPPVRLSERAWRELKERMRQWPYRRNPVRRVVIPKDNRGKRLLGIPTVVDRMFQQTIAQVLNPIYERWFSEGSYGFRPRRECKKAQLAATKIV